MPAAGAAMPLTEPVHAVTNGSAPSVPLLGLRGPPHHEEDLLGRGSPMGDSQILLIVGLLLLIVGLLGVALKLFGAEIGALTGPGRLVAVVLGLTLLACWMWLPLPGSRQAAEDAAVERYQRRVLATCADIAEQTQGGFELFGASGVSLTIDRDGFAARVGRQISFQKVAWSRLWKVDVPDALVDEQQATRNDVRTFLEDVRVMQKATKARPEEQLELTTVQQLVDESGMSTSGAALSASLADLAGESCDLTSDAS